MKKITFEEAISLLHKHGVCTGCGDMYSHDIDSPHASCKCHTSEWYDLTPYMELEKQIYILKDKYDKLTDTVVDT